MEVSHVLVGLLYVLLTILVTHITEEMPNVSDRKDAQVALIVANHPNAAITQRTHGHRYHTYDRFLHRS